MYQMDCIGTRISLLRTAGRGQASLMKSSSDWARLLAFIQHVCYLAPMAFLIRKLSGLTSRADIGIRFCNMLMRSIVPPAAVFALTLCLMITALHREKNDGTNWSWFHRDAGLYLSVGDKGYELVRCEERPMNGVETLVGSPSTLS